ncbi:hypothetical protein [Novosphingobium sp. PhB165]|nr:hypothetical protein [Novosphingobium sp. PhB165]
MGADLLTLEAVITGTTILATSVGWQAFAIQRRSFRRADTKKKY